ncbi:unnamed protein product [Cylicocyclus nassatus]|uniref:Uncharacterized protein n=1 Tax=Cylicocyclus nassatus TaxID=53992 RepID=A0AA36HAF8_CYLNA|nr:unnamed protein product [Cylicocyclus nassatus]
MNFTHIAITKGMKSSDGEHVVLRTFKILRPFGVISSRVVLGERYLQNDKEQVIMSSGAIVNFAASAHKLKEAQQEKLHKPTIPGPIRKISAPFKALASELSTAHKKKNEDSILDTMAEKLDVAAEAIPTPIRKLSAPLKTLASQMSTSDHNNNGEENGLVDTVAQKLDEAKDTVVEKAKEAKEFVTKEAKIVNDKLEQITGD